MNVVRGTLKIVVALVALCALPFVIEILLNSYELARNPWTKLGAIVTDGGPVKAGLNRRLFNEIRFRSTGMRLYFNSMNLTEKQADSLISDVAGKVHIIKDEEEILTYNFRLEQNLKKNVGGLDALEKLGAAGLIGIAHKFDVECKIVPATAEDRVAADALYKREFGVGEAVEIAFEFEGTVPEESKLTFCYSKSPSSLLHGTFLERIGKRFTGSNL